MVHSRLAFIWRQNESIRAFLENAEYKTTARIALEL